MLMALRLLHMVFTVGLTNGLIEGCRKHRRKWLNFGKNIISNFSLVTVSQMELLVKLKIYGLAAVILLCVILVVYYLIVLIKRIVDSITRNPDTTIIENELCILRVLLQRHKILLDENSEVERTKSLFKK